MKIGEICSRIVAFATKDMPLPEAAKLMRQHHVGSLVVVQEESRGRVPVGIVTDRDIVVEVLAPELDYRNMVVGEIMSSRLITARETDEMLQVLHVMRQRGIRRMPVVMESGVLAGIVTLDDLLEIVAEELEDLVDAIAGERMKEEQARR
jgi:CBS domain-containing protein